MFNSLRLCAVIFPWFFFLIGSFSFGQTFSLAERFENEKNFPGSGMSGELLNHLKKRHLVFVDGIMNELAKIPNNYFYDSLLQAKNFEISATHLSYPSHQAIPENAIQLCRDLKSLYQKVQTPLILIGHSMGGAEALHCVLRNPELLIKNQIDRVVLMEAAIGGSVLASDVKDTFYSRALRYALGEGLQSLTREQSHDQFEQSYQVFQKKLAHWAQGLAPTDLPSTPQSLHQNLSQRVFYVRSTIPRSATPSWGVRVVQAFVDLEGIRQTSNDGLMAVEDQMLQVAPPFGTDLGILNADHIELVVAGVVSHSSQAVRMAFLRALLQTIYEGKDESVSRS